MREIRTSGSMRGAASPPLLYPVEDPAASGRGVLAWRRGQISSREGKPWNRAVVAGGIVPVEDPAASGRGVLAVNREMPESGRR